MKCHFLQGEFSGNKKRRRDVSEEEEDCLANDDNSNGNSNEYDDSDLEDEQSGLGLRSFQVSCNEPFTDFRHELIFNTSPAV